MTKSDKRLEIRCLRNFSQKQIKTSVSFTAKSHKARESIAGSMPSGQCDTQCTQCGTSSRCSLSSSTLEVATFTCRSFSKARFLGRYPQTLQDHPTSQSAANSWNSLKFNFKVLFYYYHFDYIYNQLLHLLSASLSSQKSTATEWIIDY